MPDYMAKHKQTAQKTKFDENFGTLWFIELKSYSGMLQISNEDWTLTWAQIANAN